MGSVYKKIRKAISPYYRNCEMHFKIIWYNMHRKQIMKGIQAKKHVRVVFFVVNLSMWRCESLFRLLLSDSRFEPIIVPMPRPEFNWDAEKEEQFRVIEYCKRMGFPYVQGYDYDHDSYNGYSELKPDLVFYSQPYNSAYPVHKIEAFWKRCLFFYVPYCFIIEKTAVPLNTLYMNICQKVFLENEITLDFESRKVSTHGSNFMVSGYLNADRLMGSQPSDNDIWNIRNAGLKKVIWAPHHSILENDELNYSNFLDIADDMLELAKGYEGKVQFAFKPHPGLKPKLYDLEGWGKERTDSYYSQWESMPGSILSQGEYAGLFRSSDAMIHDCSSFTVEYLYTGKPVMYLAKSDHLDYMNELGTMCFNMHYKGSTVNDIRSFIDNVVLAGNDTMKAGRDRFVRDTLMFDNVRPAAESVFDYLVELINPE